MSFQELSGEQTRRLIDAEQRFSPYRDVIHKLYHSYRGSMQWKRVKERDYLYHTVDQVSKSLGPRTTDAEEVVQAFNNGRTRLRERRDKLLERIEKEARVDRAMGLGRVPATIAEIMRKLDRNGLLGKGVSVVGTNAIYAYERMAGGHFAADLLATGDIDLMFDSRRRLKLVGPNQDVEGLAGLLKRVDPSFEVVEPGAFRATNDEGFVVELIQPMKAALHHGPSSVGDRSDLQAAEIEGLAWLQNAPSIEQILLDERGLPFVMIVPDPRAFALHKLWVSERPDREPVKARRDREQAKSVARLINRYLTRNDFTAPELSSLPAQLRQRAGELLSQA